MQLYKIRLSIPFAWLCICVSGFTGNAIAQADSSIPYYPHPERQTQASIQNNYATLLASDALHRIAMAHDSVNRETQFLIRTRLLELQNATTLLGYLPLSATTFEQDQSLRSSINIWLNTFPSTRAQVSSRLSQSVDDILALSVELSDFANELEHRPNPRSVNSSLASLSYGPTSHEQPELFRQLRQTALDFCRGRSVDLTELNLPRQFSMALGAAENTRFLIPLIEGFLGDNKTCASLARDVYEIVTPHYSAIGSNRQGHGQVEGLTVFLTKNYFGRVQGLLRHLSRVPTLPTGRSELHAIANALQAHNPTSREILLLIGLATHNHSVEFYIQKALIDLNPDKAEGTKAAQKSLAGINHLYRLLQDFRVLNHIREPRYYHYWGGALVACEMRQRGYNDWVVRLVGKILGTVYEEWSRDSSDDHRESFTGSREDISLHDRGAAWGSVLCSPNP